MALIKPYDTPQGVTATYHRIVRVEYTAADNTTVVALAIFATPEAREENKQPLWHEYVTIPGVSLPEDLRALLYPILASQGGSYLEGATST